MEHYAELLRFYGILITVVMGILTLTLSVLGAIIISAYRKQGKMIAEHHDEIIVLEKDVSFLYKKNDCHDKGINALNESLRKKIYDTRSDFTKEVKTLGIRVQELGKDHQEDKHKLSERISRLEK